MTNTKELEILVLPGDGVGPEVVGQAVRVIDSIRKLRSKALNVNFKVAYKMIGGIAIDKTGWFPFYLT